MWKGEARKGETRRKVCGKKKTGRLIQGERLVERRKLKDGDKNLPIIDN